jgi:hypothetical protein
MKALFISNNIFLIGVLGFLFLYEFSLRGFEWLSFFVPLILVTLLVVAILFASNILNNQYVMWLLFSGYLIAAASMFFVFLDLAGTGSKYVQNWEVLLALLTTIALSFNFVFILNLVRDRFVHHRSKTQKLEEKYYQEIADELESGRIDKALWTKATALSGGNENETKSVYIKLRVKKLKKENVEPGDQTQKINTSSEPQSHESHDWLTSDIFLRRMLVISGYAFAGFAITSLFILSFVSEIPYIDLPFAILLSVAIWFCLRKKIVWKILVIVIGLLIGWLLALPLYVIPLLILSGCAVFGGFGKERFLLSKNHLLRIFSVTSHIFIASITIFLPVRLVSRYFEDADIIIAIIAPFVAILFIYLFLRTNYENVQERWHTSDVPWLRMFSITMYAMPIVFLLTIVLYAFLYSL